MMAKTGDEVLAYCGSCKMDLKAVVVAMAASKIARVMCKTCKKERSYRGPIGAKEPGAPGLAPASRTRITKADRTIIPVKTVTIEEEWNTQMAAAKDAPRIEYAISATLKEGFVVKHPTFGEGLVVKLHHPNKAEILFRSDIKLLMHSKVDA